MIVLYSVLLFTLSLYSYALIDPNITFINNPLWSRFLEIMLQLGYYQRNNSWIIYVTVVILLFIFHFYFLKTDKKIYPIRLSIVIGGILLLSYPFLSHDFLKYMFDAKIVTVYHQNPYIVPPLSFAKDPWLRFTQWVQQPFRYGPIFLGLSLIPSWLSGGKFFLDFILFKLTNVIFYVVGVYFMTKLNRRWGVFLATQPLLLMDGLVNGHNDVIGLSIMIVGIYFLLKKRQVLSRVILFISAGIKYLTLPIIFLSSKKTSRRNKIVFLFFFFFPLSFLIHAVSSLFQVEIQTWYFIGLLGFIAFYEETLMSLSIFFFGLLMAYYPFIRFGKWITFAGFDVRHIIIVTFFVVNIIFIYIKKKRLLFV